MAAILSQPQCVDIHQLTFWRSSWWPGTVTSRCTRGLSSWWYRLGFSRQHLGSWVSRGCFLRLFPRFSSSRGGAIPVRQHRDWFGGFWELRYWFVCDRGATWGRLLPRLDWGSWFISWRSWLWLCRRFQGYRSVHFFYHTCHSILWRSCLLGRGRRFTRLGSRGGWFTRFVFGNMKTWPFITDFAHVLAAILYGCEVNAWSFEGWCRASSSTRGQRTWLTRELGQPSTGCGAGGGAGFGAFPRR